jgi:hypothetical protein
MPKLESPDVRIYSESVLHFANQVSEFVSIIKNESSLYHVKDPYILSNLIDCTKEITLTPDGYCPRIFDAWSCFSATQPNSLQKAPCPDFPVLKFAKQHSAFKLCDEDGSWWVHPVSNRTWSNYTSCVDYQDLVFRNAINTLSIFVLCASLMFLILSLFIFS